MFKFKFNETHLITFFIAYFFISKLYFLYFNPINIGSNVIALNTQIFYNAKSFEFLPQSFHDWNHPGTPLYYYTNIVSLLIGGLHINNLQNFLLFNHIIFYMINILSIIYFVNYFKSKIDLKNIIIFFLIIFSFDTNLLAIENIDYTALQVPISLFILIFTFKVLDDSSYTNLISLSIILAFSISIIMVFLPFIICSFLALFNKLIICGKKFKKFSLTFLSFIIFFLLFNFPIIGRLPKIFYNVLFAREDTSFNLLDTFDLLKKAILFFAEHNIFLGFLIIIFLSFTIYEITKNIFLKKLKFIFDSKIIFLSSVFFFFLYTLIVASKEMPGNNLVQGVLLRNTYLYSCFIFISFFLIVKNKIYNKIYSFILTLSFLSFILTNYTYTKVRNDIIASNKINNAILKQEVGKYVSENSKILVYSDVGYGYEDFSIFSRGNSIFAGEKFTFELINKFPNLRYLRIHDIINDNFGEFSSIQSYPFYDKFDKKIKSILPYNLYLILSHKSFHHTGGSFTDPKRSKDLFIKSSPNDNIDIIIFNKTHLLEGVDINKFISYLNSKSKLKYDDSFNIGEDIWYIIY